MVHNFLLHKTANKKLFKNGRKTDLALDGSTTKNLQVASMNGH
jgi:hypothetical protein